MNRCEDYPCCGHTYDDPCGPQWYDAPDAFDTTKNPHALCDHESGDCDVDYDEDECDGDEEYCPEGGCPKCSETKHAKYFGYDGMEDQWLDGSYEE